MCACRAVGGCDIVLKRAAACGVPRILAPWQVCQATRLLKRVYWMKVNFVELLAFDEAHAKDMTMSRSGSVGHYYVTNPSI